jgi:outer membrane lipoprotein SlyB
MHRSCIFGLAFSILAVPAFAGDDTVKAAVGGGVGGAVGAAVGEELGDRKGAIIGGAIGGAVGAAIATDGNDQKERSSAPVHVVVEHGHGHPQGKFCPPGQAKKGRC